MMNFQRLFLLSTVLFGVQAASGTARAERLFDTFDTLPSFSWSEMQHSELVVAAHYESHTTNNADRDDPDVRSGLIRVRPQNLTLKVDRVLKGKGIKPGNMLKVELRHWYSIETYPTGDFQRRNTPPTEDGIPRLCYQNQSDSRSLVRPSQIVPDVRQGVLYFFPKASAPALERKGQVQSLDMEGDWKLAVNGYTPSLPFRLTQDTSEKVRQSALDELDVKREPTTLDLLFDWLSVPYSRNLRSRASHSALIAIGDQKGDVYNRAFKRLLGASHNSVSYDKLNPAEQEQYRRAQLNNENKQQHLITYASILAQVDGDRAARDFERFITQKHPTLSAIALNQLGSTDSDYALDVAFKLLKNAETVRAGAETIRNLINPSSRNGVYYRGQTPRTAHLKSLAIPRLKEALQLSTFDASRSPAPLDPQTPWELRYFRTLRETLEGYLPREAPAAVDLAHAEQVLLHPNIDNKKLIASPFQTDWTPVEKEGVGILVAINEERNPRFIPLLVALMKGASPWLKTQEGYQVISNYWQMFPHSFKSELDKQGLTAPVLQASLQEGFPGNPGHLLGKPTALWSLAKYDNSGFGLRSLDDGYSLQAKRYKSSPALLQALTDHLNWAMDNNLLVLAIDLLHIRFVAEPITARPIIEKALSQKFGTNPGASVLALGVAAGHEELVDELLDLFPVSTYGPPLTKAKRDNWTDTRALLWANHPRALQRYLQIVDEALTLYSEDGAFYDRVYAGHPSPEQMMQALFAHHPREFFERTLRLLRSSVPSRRLPGTTLLENALYWDMDFAPAVLTRERTAQLKTIVPLVERFASLAEEPMRLALLQHFGVTLPKDFQKQETTLRQLLAHPNSTVARNALRLLELQTGDYYVDFLWFHPTTQRERLWKAMVADHALAEKETPLPLRMRL